MPRKYVANFENGVTITRESANLYTFAWVVTYKDGYLESGFAKTADLADKSARRVVNFYTKANASQTEFFAYEVKAVA